MRSPTLFKPNLDKDPIDGFDPKWVNMGGSCDNSVPEALQTEFVEIAREEKRNKICPDLYLSLQNRKLNENIR
jgi:hypothetical protein